MISPGVERQLAVLLDLTRTMTEANDLHTALHGALRPIAEATGWCYGEVWLPADRMGALRSASRWHEDAPGLSEFAASSERLRFTPGMGLLGRAWEERRADWIADFGAVDLTRAVRPERLLRAGLRSGLILPIVVHDTVLALLVFFACQVRPQNDPLLRLLNLAAAQFGAAIYRLQAQEAARAREALHRSVTDSAAAAIVAADPDRRILTWNPAAERAFGYSAAEALGQPLEMLLQPPHRQHLSRLMDGYPGRSPAGAAGATFEASCLTRGGAEFPAEISLATWSSAEGECFTSIISDISERRRGEAELHALNAQLEARVVERTRQYLRANETLIASEQRYRQVVEDTTEVIFRTDAEGIWTLLNPAWTAITGFAVAESLGQPFIDSVYPEDREQTLALFVPLVTCQKEYCRHEVRYLTRDGGHRWVAVFARVTVDAGGAITGTCGTLTDITERVEVERALRAAQDQLRLANADLERGARLKDEFLATMSHELRTPLSAILSLTEAVTEGVYGALNERQRRALDAVAESGQHLLALINDILDITKIESGKAELMIEPVDIEVICASSLRMVRQLAYAKRLTLSSSLDPAVDVIAADPRRLKQILVNLLSNAVKFTPEGGSVSLEVRGDSAAGVVRFTVQDSGIGIDEVDIPRLFKPFVQLDSSLSRRHEGTGLGLALVSNLAGLHGGSIGVSSALGQGSRFVVSLPWRP